METSSSWAGLSSRPRKMLATTSRFSQSRVLEDRGDAQTKGRRRIGQDDMFAIEGDRPRGGLVHTGKDLHQRGFPGAVVADKRHDLAGMNVEIDVGQGGHGAEILGNAAKAQDQFAWPLLRVIDIRDRGHFRVRLPFVHPGRGERPGSCFAYCVMPSFLHPAAYLPVQS